MNFNCIFDDPAVGEGGCQINPKPEFDVIYNYLLVVCYKRSIVIIGGIETDEDISEEDDIGDDFEGGADFSIETNLERDAHNLVEN